MKKRWMNRPVAPWWVFLSVLLAIAGCDDDVAPPTPQEPPSLLPDGCDEPSLPALAGLSEQTVGDGTPESCTREVLQEALDVGGEIRFDCGEDPVTIAVADTLIVIGTTALRGEGGIALDGGDAVRILRTDNGSTVVLDGLTFQNGHAGPSDEGGAKGSGGAVYRGWNSTLHVVDCRFIDNRAEATDGFAGGAIGTASSGWNTLVRSTFTDNSAPYGGAVYSLLSDLTVIDCAFENNEATDDSGGAIFTDGAYVAPDAEHGTSGGQISLCGSRFTANSARASSGAGFLYAYGTDQLVVHRCEFRENSVTTADPGLGGALRMDAHAFVSQSLFAQNTTAGQGGALWMGRGPAEFSNVTFFENHASLWGGAISCGDQDVALINCTLADNAADEGADCLFCDEGLVRAENSIFARNGDEPDVRNSCNAAIDGERNLVYPVVDGDLCGDGFLHDDPRLGEALEALGGFTDTLPILEGSPAIDMGTSCPASDQRGESRNPDRCDLGAFER